MITIPLNNNILIYVSKSEDNDEKIIFKVKDTHNRYFEKSLDYEEFQDLFEDDMPINKFFEYLENNKPSLLESNEKNEILLKINAKRSMTIILHETNINNKTIKIKDFINEDIPKNNNIINNELEIFKPLKIEIANNEHLNISMSNMKDNYINIIYINKNNNKIYKASYEFDEIKDFYKGLSENYPTTEKGDNEKEIKLKIIYQNKNLTIILKEIALKNDIEIKKLKEKYSDKMKKMKEKYEILYNKNKELKEKIDKEMIKNDEIVRVYLENKLKYEDALKKYNEIQKLSVNI